MRREVFSFFGAEPTGRVRDAVGGRTTWSDAEDGGSDPRSRAPACAERDAKNTNERKRKRKTARAASGVYL